MWLSLTTNWFALKTFAYWAARLNWYSMSSFSFLPYSIASAVNVSKSAGMNSTTLARPQIRIPEAIPTYTKASIENDSLDTIHPIARRTIARSFSILSFDSLIASTETRYRPSAYDCKSATRDFPYSNLAKDAAYSTWPGIACVSTLLKKIQQMVLIPQTFPNLRVAAVSRSHKLFCVFILGASFCLIVGFALASINSQSSKTLKIILSMSRFRSFHNSSFYATGLSLTISTVNCELRP